jgi:arylsulfatase
MSSTRPNIVMVTADQWRADTLGVIPSEHPVLTPHLDQLADEGVRFSHAWADCPICMPQRATLLTGKTGSTLGVTTNFHHRTPVDRQRSLPALLRSRAGYQTEWIGKTHVVPERARLGFDDVVLHPDDYVNRLEEAGYGGFFRGHGIGGNEVVPAPNPLPEALHSSRWITDRAVEFLYRRDPEAPFFLWVTYEAPHPPFDPPEAYVRLYDGQPIAAPRPSPWHPSDEPVAFQRRRLMHNWDRLSPEWAAQSRRYYYAHQTFIDYQLGRLFGELKSRGMWDETCVIFHSDHGEHLGDYGLYGKTTFLRGSADVPLVVKPPTHVQWTPGSVCEAPVQNADLPVTIADTCGIGALDEPDGISLQPHLSNPQDNAHRDRLIFGEFGGPDGSVTAIGPELRYIWYPEGGSEQIVPAFGGDTTLDSLATLSDAHRPVATAMKRQLAEWLSENGSSSAVDGELVAREAEEMTAERAQAYRAQNPMAWRGPIRYGRGYGGGY